MGLMTRVHFNAIETAPEVTLTRIRRDKCGNSSFGFKLRHVEVGIYKPQTAIGVDMGKLS